MTKRVCVRLIRKQWLRPVEVRPVVPRALESLLAEAQPPQLVPVALP